MNYEWDEKKRQWSLLHRGIDFETAASFAWETALVVEDDRKSYGEKRFIATGFIGNRLHVMAFTVRSESIRVISLRKANERERNEYEKTIDR